MAQTNSKSLLRLKGSSYHKDGNCTYTRMNVLVALCLSFQILALNCVHIFYIDGFFFLSKKTTCSLWAINVLGRKVPCNVTRWCLGMDVNIVDACDFHVGHQSFILLPSCSYGNVHIFINCDQSLYFTLSRCSDTVSNFFFPNKLYFHWNIF